MNKQRIDRILTERKLAATLPEANALVMSGVVLVNEKRIEKSSEMFAEEVSVRIKGAENKSKYVGRGGLKLEKAITEFHICPTGYICLDVGSSTGGFTDCLLQIGARKVIAVDAGTNQLDWKLRKDNRVEVRENTNARHLKPENFTEKFDLIVMDVSFISATKILAALPNLLTEDGQLIILIKPQFEVRRSEVGTGGIVSDPQKHLEVIEKVNVFAESVGFFVKGLIESPIAGMEGNKEFLGFYVRNIYGSS